MNKLTILLIALLFSGLTVIAQGNPPFSRMDVFELEWVSDPQISPDGDWVVYGRSGMDIMQDRRQSRLWLARTDGSEHYKLTDADRSESGARWSPSGDRIAFRASTDEGTEIFIYWVESGKVAQVSQLERSPGGLSWSPDGKQLAFSMHVPEAAPTLVQPPKKPKGAEWAEQPRVEMRLKHEADGSGYLEPGYDHLFVIPAEGGTARQVTSGDYHHDDTPVWSENGEYLFFSANRHDEWMYDRRNSEIYRVRLSDGAITPLTDREGPDGSPALSPGGSQIAYLGYDDRVQTYQVNHIYLMNADGTGKREIETGLDRNPYGLVWDAEGDGLYFQYDDQGNTKIGYTDLQGNTELIAHNLGGTAIGRPYGGGSFSLAGTGRIAYTHTTPYHPAELAIVEKGMEEAELVMSLNDDLLGRRTLGQLEEIRYSSTVDGREIQGWIVKPPNFDPGRKYRLLVENHGGPISNYGDRFSPEIQLYASADYVVFYPNPRGSTSYGEEFGNLLYHDYPGDDYHDVMDGVDAVLELGYVAEDSLYVTGGSAGGIMTAWMIGKTDRFRSAAVVKPVMNWFSKTLTADNYYGYAYYRYPGQPWENPEVYMEYSPISLVGNVSTPTLVMVGTADLRTPLSEAKQLYHALKLRKVETALVEIPGAYHFISNRPSQLIAKVDHVLAWFE